MLSYMAENPDVRTILVETASRFARDLAVQITGHDLLKAKGIALIPVDAPNHFTDETPTAVMVRQILGSVAQFQKAVIVSNLRVARERKRANSGKCEGRKSHAEVRPEIVEIAKQIRGRGRKKTPYREIAARLASSGHFNSAGRPFGPSAVKSMLEGP